MRIQRTGSKIAFVVILVLIFVLFAGPLSKAPEPYGSIFSVLLLLAIYLGSARTFRGVGEAVGPPRAWWRMTSRPTAGFVVGAWIAGNAATSALVVLAGIVQPGFGIVLSIATYVVLAGLYCHSSIRLIRHLPEPMLVEASGRVKSTDPETPDR